MPPTVLAFGDGYGLPMLVRHLPAGALVGVVASALRPQYFEALKEIAAMARVPFLVQPKSHSVDAPSFAAQVRTLSPDFIIVNSYSLKVPAAVLSCASQGAINVHAAALPRYRGPNPIQWAIIRGESESGVTMHHMTERFDAGDVVAQRRVPIDFGDTWRDVQAKVEDATDRLLAESLPLLLSGHSRREPQDESLASAFPRRRPEDGRIEWSASVVAIYNLIRALVRPLPGAYYETEAGRVILDSYLSVPEVVALKFGAVGKGRLDAGTVRLHPVPADPGYRHAAAATAPPDDERRAHNSAIAFVIADDTESSRGRCQWAVDWRARVATVSVQWGDDGAKDLWPDVQEVLRRLARDQFGLSAVWVDGSGTLGPLDLDGA